MFGTHLNLLEPQKKPKKSKKVTFRDLKIGAGDQKLAPKYFLLVSGPKKFHRPLPLSKTYMQEKSAILAKTPPPVPCRVNILMF